MNYLFSLVFMSLLLPLSGVVHVETFQGRDIEPYIPQIVQLCHRIYRAPPYLYDGQNEGYETYLESYAESNAHVVALAFDKDQVVGLAAGMPMSKKGDLYQQPFIDHSYPLDKLFYLGEFGLAPEYHGQGIEEVLYQHIEDFARKTGQFTTLCFWEIDQADNQNVQSYFPSNPFWMKMGFIQHPELNISVLWTNIGETQESSHTAVYWLKDL